jgi:hypothetical protein
MGASFVIFGVDLSTVNWYLVFYVLFGITVTAMGTTQLYPMGLGRAIIYAIGAIMVFIFFGYRWFSDPVKKSKKWPPTINTCPDYLTFVPSVNGSSSLSGGGCVDLLGVSTNASGLQVSTQTKLATISATDTNNLFEFTSADVAAAANDPTQMQHICTRCQIAGITWEGVWDGDTCAGLNRAKLVSQENANCSAQVSSA